MMYSDATIITRGHMSIILKTRQTVPVSERSLAAFKRISLLSGVSVGRSISAWLDDTIEAAEYMAEKMEATRSAPRILSHELNAYAAGLSVAAETIISSAKSRK
jgi:hypothetical protein